MAKHTHGSHLGGANVIRPRSRVQTALFPHSHNRRFLIPKRKQGPIIQAIIFKTISTTVEFDVDVTTGDAVGFTLFNNTTGLAVAIVSAINGNANEIVVNYGAQTLVDNLTLTYAPGAWTSAVGQVNGFIQIGDVQ